MLNLKKIVCAAFALLVANMVFVAPASAQATRTWVSGVGDDANPCSRTAPCKTFAGAISKTAPNGEINCLDPGGFGAVVITKSISIICTTAYGSVLVSGTNGITVNAADTDIVLLKGLDLEGLGAGVYGINFVNAAALHVEDVSIRGFATQAIQMNTAAGKTQALFLKNIQLSRNGNTGISTTGTIKIAVQGTGAVANAVLENIRANNNANVGLRVDQTAVVGGTVNLSVKNSEFTYNSGAGLQFKVPAGTGTLYAVVESIVTAQNTYGIIANGSGASVAMANSTIAMNGTGIMVNGGAQLNTFGDNRLYGNTTPGAFPLPPLAKQ